MISINLSHICFKNETYVLLRNVVLKPVVFKSIVGHGIKEEVRQPNVHHSRGVWVFQQRWGCKGGLDRISIPVNLSLKIIHIHGESIYHSIHVIISHTEAYRNFSASLCCVIRDFLVNVFRLYTLDKSRHRIAFQGPY